MTFNYLNEYWSNILKVAGKSWVLTFAPISFVFNPIFFYLGLFRNHWLISLVWHEALPDSTLDLEAAFLIICINIMSLLGPLLELSSQLLPEWSPGWLQGPYLCARWVTQHKAVLWGSLCSCPVPQQVPSHLCPCVFMSQHPKGSLIFYYRTIISPLQCQPANASACISSGSLSSGDLPAGLGKPEHWSSYTWKCPKDRNVLPLDQIPDFFLSHLVLQHSLWQEGL